MNLLNNLKLRTKILLLSLFPALIACITAMVISNTLVKSTLLSDVKNELHATASAVLSAYDQNSGDYFVNKSGDVWKGAYNVSLSESLIDDIADKTGIDLTFFYGDKRLVTSLKDKEGRRITGSAAGEFLVKNVLNDGNSVFTNRIDVDGEMYFGYYIPVYQNGGGEIVGMVFAGLPVSKVMKNLNLITKVFGIAIVIILVLTTVICVLVGNGIAGGIQKSIGVVKEIAGGNLTVKIADKDLKRHDEVGALSASTKILQEGLYGIIGTISGNTSTLNTSSQEMNSTATEAKEGMDKINSSLKEVLSAARQQSGSTETATESIRVMENMLSDNLNEIDNLQGYTDNMLKSSETAKNSLKELEIANNRVLEVVGQIQKETVNTGESVVKIRSAVDIITDIAEETNLLSLNASIEAAKAGESGRSFAVVAQNISKLAEQSNAASQEITEMIAVLDKNSEKTIQTMDIVQEVVNRQTDNVKESREEFNMVEKDIHNVAEGVGVIKDVTEKLNKETGAITREITDLRELAAQNEQNAESTLKVSEGISEIVSTLNQMSGDLSGSANEMSNAVSNFEM